MSLHAMAWAFDQPVTPSGAKFVLVTLANFADEDGSCFPGQERLAEMTGQDVRSVRRHLTALERDGYLSRKHRPRPEGSGRSSDRYTLNLAGSTGQSVRKVLPDTVAVLPDTFDSSTGQDARGTVREPSVEPSDSGATLPPSFSEWWKAYPRKDDKVRAMKAYARALKRVDSPDILRRGLDPWLEYWTRRDEPEFIPLPTTWLNNDRWTSTPPPLRAGLRSVQNDWPVGYDDPASPSYVPEAWR